MKSIAVASNDRTTVTAHAGRCRRFWLYSVEDGVVVNRTLLELGANETLHAVGNGAHPIMCTSVLISGGLGDGLMNRLALHGVRGVVTSERNPDRAVRKYLLGTLETLPAAVRDAEESVV